MYLIFLYCCSMFRLLNLVTSGYIKACITFGISFYSKALSTNFGNFVRRMKNISWTLLIQVYLFVTYKALNSCLAKLFYCPLLQMRSLQLKPCSEILLILSLLKKLNFLKSWYCWNKDLDFMKSKLTLIFKVKKASGFFGFIMLK